MPSRFLALLMALVIGLCAGWTAVAAAGPLPAVEAAAEHTPEPRAELPGSQPVAEGAPDLPALFLAGPAAHAPRAIMAPPRPHAAASWQRLYLNVPRRPPRSWHATA